MCKTHAILSQRRTLTLFLRIFSINRGKPSPVPFFWIPAPRSGRGQASREWRYWIARMTDTCSISSFPQKRESRTCYRDLLRCYAFCLNRGFRSGTNSLIRNSCLSGLGHCYLVTVHSYSWCLFFIRCRSLRLPGRSSFSTNSFPSIKK